MFWGRADTALHLYEIAWVTTVCFLSVVGTVAQHEDVWGKKQSMNTQA